MEPMMDRVQGTAEVLGAPSATVDAISRMAGPPRLLLTAEQAAERIAHRVQRGVQAGVHRPQSRGLGQTATRRRRRSRSLRSR